METNIIDIRKQLNIKKKRAALKRAAQRAEENMRAFSKIEQEHIHQRMKKAQEEAAKCRREGFYVIH